MPTFLRFIAFLPILWRLQHTSCWTAARAAVQSVAADFYLNQVSASEPEVRYCPHCGQVPDGDRRMDRARSLALKTLGKQPPRHELDAAIALHYFVKKKGYL